MSGEATSLEGWYILELYGHNVVAGHISEQAIAGAPFVRVDVPEVEDRPAFTKFYNGSAIYAATPTDEATAREAARRLAVRPVSLWVIPDSRRELPAPAADYREDDDWDGEDDRF